MHFPALWGAFFIYFLNQKVMKIKQSKKINFPLTQHRTLKNKWSATITSNIDWAQP